MSDKMRKPIRWKPRPAPSALAEYMTMKCDRCGALLADDMRAGFRHEDEDKGDHIERREVEQLCGSCMNAKGTKEAQA